MKTCKIMIVEDEAVIAIDLQARLEGFGYTVVGIVDNGADAVRRVREWDAQLVFMDIQIKGPINGIVTAEEIRKQFDLPIIFMTAYSDDATIHRAREAQPYGYILKPCEDRELRIAVELALHKHESEKTLRRMERWLATTLSSVGDGVIATDVDGCVNFMNPVAETLTGWTSSAAFGRPFMEVFAAVHGKTGQPLGNPIQVALNRGLNSENDDGAQLTTRDGSTTYIDYTAAPSRNPKGQVTGAVVVFRDVTPKVVAERERSLNEEKNRQVQKMEVVGRLAGGIAHDFNNLMTVILGQSELLLDKHKDPLDGDHKRLAAIQKAGTRASELTRQLLAFARKQMLRPEVCSLNRLVREMYDLIRRVTGSKCTMQIAMADGQLDVFVDKTQFGQVLLNLCMNARDAMPNGGALRIMTSRATVSPSEQGPRKDWKAGEYAILKVSDNGTGMDANVLSHLFEPFFTTKEQGKGTGLGLSTVQGIVAQSNGYIHVDSQLGVGSTFSIFIPIHKTETSKQSTTAIKQDTTELGDKTIFLVEDDAVIREVYSEAFKMVGSKLIESATGEEALEKFNAMPVPPDLLLTDIVMPGMSGSDLGTKMRERVPDLKILYHSGYDRQFLSGVLKQLDRKTDFLEKPARPREVLERVRKLLSQS